MNYDTDPDTGKLTRVCTPCLEGTSEQNDYVLDIHHGEIQCPYCDAWGATAIKEKPRWYKCAECGEQFWRY